MKKYFLLLFCFVAAKMQAQNPTFLGTVQIEYEKTLSVHQLMKQMEPEWFEQSKDHMPVELKSYFSFTGDSTHSIFKQSKEAIVPTNMWFRPIADENVVYNDYTTGRTITKKPVFEETFLVDDSLLKIKWKITNDTRNIVGFDCRKAVGIMFDTIAVFAFYTDEIMISGGPEGIHGLPGMILGMGIPRIHTTWFATKVEVSGLKMNKVVPETKGKKIKRSEMINVIKRALDEWGGYGKNLVMNFLI
jgi:GLPGLI family protein